jgi:hypothetical protein
LAITLLVLAAWSLFLMLPISTFFWQKLPLLATLQFPWRFLGLLSFLLALFTGGVVWGAKFLPRPFDHHLSKVLLTVLLATGLIYVNFKYFAPQNIIKNAASYYLDKNSVAGSAQTIAEYYPVSVTVWPQERPDSPLNPNSQQEVEIVADIPYEVIFRLDSPGQLTANRFYFPGWQLKQGEEIIPLRPEAETGRISFWAPQAGEYQLSFVTINREKIAGAISLLGLVLFLLFVFY